MSSRGGEGRSQVTGQPSCGRLLPRLHLFKEAEAARSYSAPSSPRTSAAAAARPGAGRRRPRNASSCSQQTMQTPQTPQTMQSPQHQVQHQHQAKHPQNQPQPPPYPQCAESAAAATGEAAANAAFDDAAASVNVALHRLPAAAATPSYTLQEVREISLGRHNDEPFGMKIECVSDAFYITHVVRNSVAACAGLKVGDELVRINDRRLEGLSTREVQQVIRQSEMCAKFAFKPRAVVARIREVRMQKDNGVLGLRLQKKPDGLYIEYVKAGTVAHRFGLKEGDQVLKINSHIVTDWSMEGSVALLKSLNDSEQMVLLVRETLPLANVSSWNPQQSSTECNGPQQQQEQHQQHQHQQHQHQQHQHQQQLPHILHRQITSAACAGNGILDVRCCPGPSERTASCSRLSSDVGGGGARSNGAAAVRRALGTNPCASSEDLEITRLPPETGVRRGCSTAASTSAPASSVHKSSQLTTFLRSMRLSRHQQHQHQQQPPASP